MIHLVVIRPVILISGHCQTLCYSSTSSYIQPRVGYQSLAKFEKYTNFSSGEQMKPAGASYDASGGRKTCYCSKRKP